MKINELFPEIDNENYSVEFKARLLTGLDKQDNDNELKWLKEIVAFANTQGGTLFVGVNDKTHELEPLDHSGIDEAARLLYQKVEERIEPDISLRIKEISLGKAYKDQYILRIDVEKSEKRASTATYESRPCVAWMALCGRTKNLVRLHNGIWQSLLPANGICSLQENCKANRSGKGQCSQFASHLRGLVSSKW